MAGMSIGEVARKMGLRSSAIRYYERLGLLPKAPRVSGRRRYDERVLERLAMVRFAKHVGFSVAEIKVLLSGVEGRPDRALAQAGGREGRASRSIRRPGAIDPKAVVGDAGFPMPQTGRTRPCVARVQAASKFAPPSPRQVIVHRAAISAGDRDACRARAGVRASMRRARAHGCGARPPDPAGRGCGGDARRAGGNGRAPCGDGYARARAAR